MATVFFVGALHYNAPLASDFHLRHSERSEESLFISSLKGRCDLLRPMRKVIQRLGVCGIEM